MIDGGGALFVESTTISGFAKGEGFDALASGHYTAANNGGTLTVIDGSRRFSADLDGSYAANSLASPTRSAALDTIHYGG